MLGWELHSIFRTNCNGPENNTTKEQYHTWCLKWVGKKTLQTQRANSFEGNCFLGLSSSVGYSSILQFCFPYFCNISKIMFQFLVKLRYFLLSFFPQLTKILIIILWINLLFCTEVYRTDSEVCLLTFFFFTNSDLKKRNQYHFYAIEVTNFENHISLKEEKQTKLLYFVWTLCGYKKFCYFLNFVPRSTKAALYAETKDRHAPMLSVVP